MKTTSIFRHLQKVGNGFVILTMLFSQFGWAVRTAAAIGTAESTTEIIESTPDPSYNGLAVNVSVRVSGTSGTPTGTVDITTDTNCSITLAEGIGSCDVQFTTSGEKSITATYTGDDVYAGSVLSAHTHMVGNTAPVITQPDLVSVTMSKNGSPNPFSLTLDATDADSGDTLTWSIKTIAGHGIAGVTGPYTGNSMAVTYTPNPEYIGPDSFEVQVSDGSAIDWITVDVTVNSAPVIAEGDSVSVLMSKNSEPIAFNLTLHATDADNDILSWSISSSASPGTAGASREGGTKTISYSPAPGYVGLDSFIVQVMDSNGATDSITVNVTVDPVKVGFVTDAGGITSPFNALGWHGVQDATTVIGNYYVASADNDTAYLAAFTQCVSAGNDLCIGANFFLAAAINAAAGLNPDVKFAIVDVDPGTSLANLRGLTFDSQEVAYLAGALAGKMTTTNVVGAVGGMDIPPVVAFTEGFRNGTQCANPSATVLVDYIGSFTDTAAGRAMAEGMIYKYSADKYADVIYGVGGAAGSAAILYSAQEAAWSIGVDFDEFYTTFLNELIGNSQYLLTSTMKNMDVAVYLTIQDYLNGTFTSGATVYNLASGGVGLAPFHEAATAITTKEVTPGFHVDDYINALKVEIIAGTIDLNTTCRASTLSGTVYDGNSITEGIVTGAQICLENYDTGTPVTPCVTSDEFGNYIFPTVVAGHYRIQINKTGWWGKYYSNTYDRNASQEVIVGESLNLDKYDFTIYPHLIDFGMYVSLPDNSIHSIMGWQPFSTVHLTIDDPDILGNVNYSDSQVAGTQPLPSVGGGVGFAPSSILIEPGHIITLTDPVFTKTMTVSDLGITDIDVIGDIINGKATPGDHVEINASCGSGTCTRHVIAGETGAWSANFASSPVSPDVGTADIIVGTNLTISAFNDADGPFNVTLLTWQVKNPSIVIPLTQGQVSGSDWTPGAEITLMVDDDSDPGNGVLHTYASQIATRTSADVTKTSVDFSLTGFSLLPGQYLHMSDGYTTRTIQVPRPFLTVRANDDLVEAYDWPLGSSLTMKIYTSGIEDTPEKTVTAVVTGTASLTDLRPYLSFDLGDFDVQQGHLVTVTDGTTMKSLLVTSLAFDVIDVATDTISGFGATDVGLTLWACPNIPGDCSFRRVNVTDGSWNADWSVAGSEPDEFIFNLIENNWVDSSQGDEDGDFTFYGRTIPNPSLSVRTKQYVEVEAFNWPLGSTLTLTINNGSDLVYTTTKNLVVTPGDDTVRMDQNDHLLAWALFGLTGSAELQPGYTVTLTDGVTTRSTVVTDLHFSSFDVDADTVSGHATPGASVDVWACNGVDPCAEHSVVADGSTGDWTVNFAPFNLEYGTWVDSQEWDSDHLNLTRYGRPIPQTRFEAEVWSKRLTGYDFIPAAEVNVTIDNPSTGDVNPDFATTVSADRSGWLEIYPTEAFSYSLEPDFVVTMSDGLVTKTLTIASLSATANESTNTVSGEAPAGAQLNFWLEGTDFSTPVTVDESGHWTVVLAGTGQTLGAWTFGGLAQPDMDGDTTYLRWRVVHPIIQAWLNDNSLKLYDFPAGTLNVTIHDPSDVLVFEGTTTSSTTPWYDGLMATLALGNQAFLTPGTDVTVTSGAVSASMTVANLQVTGVDLGAKTVSILTDPTTEVAVSMGIGGDTRTGTSAFDGTWTTDFSDNPDFGPGITVDASVSDSNTNATIYEFTTGNLLSCLPGDTLSGHVYALDASTPAAGVTVTFDDFTSEASLFTTLTAPDGSYSCGGLSSGSYRIVALMSPVDGQWFSRSYYPGESIFETVDEVIVGTGTHLPGLDITLSTPPTGAMLITFNLTKPIVSDILVRKAIAYGTDRQRIIDELSQTYGLGSPLMNSYVEQGHWLNPPVSGLPVYDYDPAEAALLLGVAGWSETDSDNILEKGVEHLQFNLYMRNEPTRVAAGTIFVENMAAIGIYVDMNVTADSSFIWSGVFDSTIFGWMGDENSDFGLDANDLWLYKTGGGNNVGGYSNLAVDHLLTDHVQPLRTRAEVLLLSAEIQTAIMNDLPAFPLFQTMGTPSAEAGSPQYVLQGEAVTLNGVGSSDPYNDILTYQWDTDLDGLFDDASGTSPVISFDSGGVKTVSLKVTDTYGMFNIDTATITVTACYSITTSVSPTGAGSVGIYPPTNCTGGKYVNGPLYEFTATANPGYVFSSWSGDVTGVDPAPWVPVTKNMNLTANFIRETAVLVSPSGTVNGWDNSYRWTGVSGATWYVLDLRRPDGTVVKTEWYSAIQAGCSGMTSCALGPTVLNALFKNLAAGEYKWRIVDYGGYGYGLWTGYQAFTLEPYCYTLTSNISGGSGAVNPDPTPTCNGNTQYNPGTVVQLTVAADAGFGISGWSGNASGSSNPLTVVMEGNKTVTANLKPVSVLVSPSGTVSGWDNSYHWTGVSGATWYVLDLRRPDGTVVKTEWYSAIQAGCSGTTSCALGPTVLNALFKNLAAGEYKWRIEDFGAYGYGLWTGYQAFTLEPYCYTLTSNISGGSGAVNPDPTPTCNGNTQYNPGTVVQLTVAAGAGFGISGWSGNASGSSNPLTVVMEGNKTVTANLKPVSVLVSPSGTVSGWDNSYRWTGISGATWYVLDLRRPDGTLVKTEWYSAIQAGCSGMTSCALGPTVLNALFKNLAAGEYKWRIVDYGGYGYGLWTGYQAFTLEPYCYTLTSNISGGSGAVNPDPTPTCNGNTQYNPGTVVQLTVAAGAGFGISGWSGNASGSSNPLTVVVEGNKTVTANLKPVSVLVSPSGTVSGWDNSYHWTGVSGATWYVLDLRRPDGTLVKTEWYSAIQAGCSGTTSCALGPTVLNALFKNLAAGEYKWRIEDFGAYGYGLWTGYQAFTLEPYCYTLTSNISGGSGAVNPDPTPTCNGNTQYNPGTVVQLTVAAGAGFGISGWSGNASGSSNPLTVVMEGNKTVTANLKPVSVLVSPSGTVNGWDNSYRWTGVSGATWYVLDLRRPDGTVVKTEWYSAIQAGCSGMTSCALGPTVLNALFKNLAAGEYKWRIVDYGGYGYGLWTGYQAFAIP